MTRTEGATVITDLSLTDPARVAHTQRCIRKAIDWSFAEDGKPVVDDEIRQGLAFLATLVVAMEIDHELKSGATAVNN